MLTSFRGTCSVHDRRSGRAVSYRADSRSAGCGGFFAGMPLRWCRASCFSFFRHWQQLPIPVYRLISLSTCHCAPYYRSDSLSPVTSDDEQTGAGNSKSSTSNSG